MPSLIRSFWRESKAALRISKGELYRKDLGNRLANLLRSGVAFTRFTTLASSLKERNEHGLQQPNADFVKSYPNDDAFQMIMLYSDIDRHRGLSSLKHQGPIFMAWVNFSRLLKGLKLLSFL